jgi:MBOAT, membrane-bound O-acyltransferase family
MHNFLLRHVYALMISSYQISHSRATLATFLLFAAAHELVMAIVTKKVGQVRSSQTSLFAKKKIVRMWKQIVYFCAAAHPDSHDCCHTVASDQAQQVPRQRDDLVAVVCGVPVTVRSLRLLLLHCLVSGFVFGDHILQCRLIRR